MLVEGVVAAAEAEELLTGPDANESATIATPREGSGRTLTPIAKQPTGATFTASVRPLGSSVETTSRAPPPARPRRTASAEYWVPERSPLSRLPPHRPPSYCWIVSDPARKLSGA